MGTLTIERRSGFYRDAARAYKVEVDGENVGQIGPGKSLTVDLTPGSHSARVVIDWCSSPTVMVDGDKDERLVCRPSGSAWTALFEILFSRQSYISLEKRF